LQKKIQNLIEIVNYFIFIEYFSKDTITYINNSNIKIVIRKELAKRIKRQNYNTNL